MFFDSASPTDRIQSRLLALAALFLFLFSVLLTLSPAGRIRDWNTTLRWDHWIGFAIWILLFTIAHRLTMRDLPDRDPYMLPLGAILSGWGLLTIWRLMPAFGQRQTIWLVIAVLAVMVGLRLPSNLGFLRKYKYLWLTGGLLLTALTLLLGTNPTGASSPRLWLGGMGIYLQPSEPLKLFLLIYLAAYLAGGDNRENGPVLALTPKLLPLLAPSLLMTGLALLLLVIQRDLGTATVFLFLYAVMAYVASSRKVVLFLSGGAIIAAGIAGYLLFDVVRIRVDAWVNPWLDPSGRSFQIVQSLLATANGGLLGRGPGLGNPALVPVPHSDFIFSAIVEEGGLLGAVGILTLLALLTARGLRAAIYAPDHFSRYLAAGITAHLVGQSVLIIGGNLRLLPLTGVTLPFVSYGGSSLLTSFVSLLILLHISSRADAESTSVFNTRPFLHLGFFLWTSLALAALITGWWTFFRSDDLLTRPDNARRTIADRYVARGAILDRNLEPLVATTGRAGDFSRTSYYPHLGLVTGYSDPTYGQSGLEASLDSYLRGLEGHSVDALWWNHLLYGQPPYGLDVRTSLEIDLQRMADDLLIGDTTTASAAYPRQAAMVLLNAESGNVLALASHPNFDPTLLSEQWADLVQDRRAPLFNRAVQGQYPIGAGLGPLILAANYSSLPGAAAFPPLPSTLFYTLGDENKLLTINCALTPRSNDWGAVIAAGCPRPVSVLGKRIHDASLYPNTLKGSALLGLFFDLGLYSLPELNLPAASSPLPAVPPQDVQQSALGLTGMRISPLQLARAAASISSGGVVPPLRIVLEVELPGQGWTALAAQNPGVRIFTYETASAAASDLEVDMSGIWQSLAVISDETGQTLTWYVGGTLPGARETPLVFVLLLEEYNPTLAVEIGQLMLHTAGQP